MTPFTNYAKKILFDCFMQVETSEEKNDPNF